MIRSAALAALAIVISVTGEAKGQQALSAEYGYKLAQAGAEASYLLSGIRRGAEPESVEAWVWTVLPRQTETGEDAYDARAQWSVMRCSGKSIEPLQSEYYLGGRMTRVQAAQPVLPADIRKDTPMDAVWNVACDMATRYSVKTIRRLSELYETPPTASAPAASPPPPRPL